jgi:hypothetical protein
MGGIYLRHGGSFIAMREQRYEAESLLQALIAEHPEVLAGDDEGNPRAWLLVKREAGVADRAEGADRWSLDHLFLDREGVPTLVEVKRSSDTRARREVVAQMLDYAANATLHWNAEALRAWFEAECERRGVEPQVTIDDAFGVPEQDSYWEAVRTNLAAERVRLVFVADEIAPELRSIVEFLNRQMAETEVLAVEVKQYVDAEGERQTIVPRVLGQTEAAKAAKGGGRRSARQWDERSLLEEIARRHGDDVAAIARSVIDWAKARDDVRVEYGRGSREASAKVRFDHDGAALTAFNLWSYNAVEIPFDFMRDLSQAPFADTRESRDELRRRINEAAPTANIPVEEERIRPSFKLEALADEQARQGFFAAMQWAFDQALRAQAARRGGT